LNIISFFSPVSEPLRVPPVPVPPPIYAASIAVPLVVTVALLNMVICDVMLDTLSLLYAVIVPPAVAVELSSYNVTVTLSPRVAIFDGRQWIYLLDGVVNCTLLVPPAVMLIDLYVLNIIPL
jgi:hypothetical protein